jgi:hypothetical protein
MAYAQQHVTGWTGWVGTAGFLMALVGVYHIVLGIGGVVGSDWYIYTSNNAFLFDSSAWGWSMIVGGILLSLSSYLLLIGNMVGRVVGSILVIGSIAINAALAPATPAWSAIAIALDLVILYAIIAHGGEMKQLRE